MYLRLTRDFDPIIPTILSSNGWSNADIACNSADQLKETIFFVLSKCEAWTISLIKIEQFFEYPCVNDIVINVLQVSFSERRKIRKYKKTTSYVLTFRYFLNSIKNFFFSFRASCPGIFETLDDSEGDDIYLNCHSQTARSSSHKIISENGEREENLPSTSGLARKYRKYRTDDSDI